MWDEDATQSEVPVTSLFNEAAAHSVDSTVTRRKQPGLPRESHAQRVDKDAGNEMRPA